MYECIGELFAIGFVASVVFQHYVITKRAVRVVLALAIDVRTLVILLQLVIPLPLGDFPYFETMLVALVGQALDLAVIEVFDAEEL